jgi:hypothetical protein
MPPASPYPNIAAWLDPVLLVATWGAPVLLVAVLSLSQRPLAWPRIAGVVIGILLVLVALTTLGWCISPYYARSPVASILSVLVLIGPSFVACAAAFRAGVERRWSRAIRGLAALGSAYAVMLLCVIPALVVFVSLGGDTL